MGRYCYQRDEVKGTEMAKSDKPKKTPVAKPAKMSAILGRNRRLGQWQIPARSTVLAVFGTCHIDMRKAYTEDDLKEVKMSITSIFGGVEIIVPDGVEVRPSGAAFLASSSFEVPKMREDASLPPLILETLTLFGRLRLHTVIDEAEAAERDAEIARIAEEERIEAEEAKEAEAAKKAEEEAEAKKAEEEAAEAEAKKAEEEKAEADKAEAEEEADEADSDPEASEDDDAADEVSEEASEKEAVPA